MPLDQNVFDIRTKIEHKMFIWRSLGVKPKIGEDGQSFGRRVMDDRWGRGNWERNEERLKEFRKLQKYGDRAFRIPQDVIDQYNII
jgi:hypothetical protein